jgi:cysteine synthase
MLNICTFYLYFKAKMEYLNPFGSGKDRAVKWMLEKAI